MHIGVTCVHVICLMGMTRALRGIITTLIAVKIDFNNFTVSSVTISKLLEVLQ